MTGMDQSDITVVFHPDRWDQLLAADQLPELHDWLRAHGIDPRDVDRAPISIDHQDGQRVIRYTAFLRGDDGHLYRDPVTDGTAREQRTAPLLVEPPEHFGRP